MDNTKTPKPTRIKRFSLTMMWIFVWPVAALAIGLALLAVFAAILQTDQPEDYTIYLGAYFALITTTCFLGTYLLIQSHRPVFKIGGHVLGVYTLGGVIAIIFIFSYIISYTNSQLSTAGNEQVASAFTVPTLARNENIDSILRSIGASDDEIIKFSTKYVNDFDTKIINDQLGLYQTYINVTDGTFLYGEMHIKSGQDPSQERTMIAHEYLHHIWYAALDAETKSKLESDLISIYGNDPAIRTRTVSYTSAQTLKPTELFSYYCTESSDGYLTAYILEQCNKYINRSSLHLAR